VPTSKGRGRKDGREGRAREEKNGGEGTHFQGERERSEENGGAG